MPLTYSQRWIDIRHDELLANCDVAFRNDRDAWKFGVLVEVPHRDVGAAAVIHVRV